MGVLERDPTGIAEFQVETLRTQILGILGVGLVVAAINGAALSDLPWQPLPTLIGLALAAGLAYWALRFGPIVATLVMIVGLTATLTGLLFLYPRSLLAGYFFLIVLAASGTLGWRAGLATATVASAIILTLADTPMAVVSPDVALHALGFVWATLVLAWLSNRPLSIMATWAWSNYALAQAKTEEARRGQGELARLSKSLGDACERLERLNRELAEAREAAEAARRMKAEFAATVGHELRTPVNLVIGFSQMIASPRRASYYDEPLPECYHDDLAAVCRNATHISTLVDDILDLSQIDAQRMALRKERIDLARVAREAAATVQALYADAELYLHVDVPQDIPRVPADPVRIRQVLINLLYNAVRFTHRGGVTISARQADEGVVIDVSDTGVGIPSADLPRLFEEFRQLHAPTGGHLGSGLGLAVCKRFVELHGGSIWARSAPETGTTITFSLPFHGNVAVVPLERVPAPAALGGTERPGVAVFDPEGDTARVLDRYLDGYRVRRVKSFSQVAQLQAAADLRALIVTSTVDQEAWSEYQHANPSLRAIPTLFCPLRTRQAIAETLGAIDYLVKPVSKSQLTRTLGRLRQPIRRLALIEDDPEMRLLLSRMLRARSRGCLIAEAEDGASGLDLLRRERPDVVLLDLLMPGLDGYTVLQALHHDEALHDIPVVVISAKGSNEGVTASMIGISRPDGLSVGEATACLKASLDALLPQRITRGWAGAPGGMARAP
ncbi:MAG: ATP-binding protein [Chloroflexota bacterium]